MPGITPARGGRASRGQGQGQGPWGGPGLLAGCRWSHPLIPVLHLITKGVAQPGSNPGTSVLPALQWPPFPALEPIHKPLHLTARMSPGPGLCPLPSALCLPSCPPPPPGLIALFRCVVATRLPNCKNCKNECDGV